MPRIASKPKSEESSELHELISSTTRWTIRRKLILIITGVSSIGVLLVGTMLAAFHLVSYHRHIGSNMLTQASIVANNCKSAVAFRESADAQEVLRSLRAEPAIVEAFVYDKDGVVFSAYSRVGVPKPWDAPEPQDEGFRFGADRIMVFQRVTLGADTIGSVCLSYDMDSLYGFMVQSVLWLILLVLLTMLGSGFLASRLQRVISGPIVQLAKTARSVTETRNYSVRAIKVRDDELGQLANVFNEMLGEIQTRDKALRFTQFSVDHSGDAAFWMDRDGRFVYINRAACSSLGYTEEELLDLSVFDVDPDFQPGQWEKHWQELGEQKTMIFESRHLTCDGSVIPVEITANMVDFEGRLYNCAFARNISERHRAREALRQSEERFRGIFENAVMGIYRTTKNGRITMANPALARMLGYDSPDELMMRNLEIEGFAENSSRANFTNRLERHNRIVGHESAWERKDGSTLHVSESARVALDDEGEVLYYDGTVEDITDRKQAEEELRTRERFLACLSDVSQHLMSTEDPFKALPQVLHALGITAEISRTYIFQNEIIDEDQLACTLIEEWCCPPLQSRTGNGRFRKLPYYANGLGRWAEVLGSGDLISGAMSSFPDDEQQRLSGHGIKSLLLIPLFVEGNWFGYIGFDDCEKVREWMAVEIDLLQVAAAELSASIENYHLFMRLTEHTRTLEERVETRTSELSNVNRELEAFSYSVSHDLRAPLRSIDGFSQALIEDYGETVDERAHDYLTRIRAAAQRMGHLIEDLLRLSRLSRKEMSPQLVNLSEISRDVVANLNDQHPMRTVEVIIAEGLETEADPNLLRIVLENLIGNAWKFTAERENARIVIGSQNSSSGVFFVRDNGAGFDMNYSNKLFGAFQRLHAAHEFEGTGIGLATVQRIIHRHGGKVWAEGQVDQGATFFFTFG
ncbi:MAG: PAS domain S-box protein [bacterium]|nr:PAS domain S-box protein [bacterium]